MRIAYQFLSHGVCTVNFEPASISVGFIRKIKQTTGENEPRLFERVINIIAGGGEGIVMGVEMHSTKRESHCFREKVENRKVDFDGNNTFGFVAFIG